MEGKEKKTRKKRVDYKTVVVSFRVKEQHKPILVEKIKRLISEHETDN